MYFTWEDSEKTIPRRTDSFRLSLSQMENIRRTIQEHGMGDDVLGLFSFIKGAIEGREHAKFVFTRSVSDILKYIGEWGVKEGFTREEMSYSDIRIVKDVYSGAVDEKELIRKSIESGKEAYIEGAGIILPPLIINEESVKSFFIPDSQPNYITQNRVQGELVDLNKQDIADAEELDGKILMIESADPGYDWIFSRRIKGFITKYGGANSHMAIRAGELDLPAVVGAGEKLFGALKKAQIVEIDAPKKQVIILR